MTNASTLVHYLHGQYLIEKARAASNQHKKDSQKAGSKKRKLKNIVFLVYCNRNTKDYPLIFNCEWKHLFLDALLPANQSSFQQIQINDINIFDKAYS